MSVNRPFVKVETTNVIHKSKRPACTNLKVNCLFWHLWCPALTLLYMFDINQWRRIGPLKPEHASAKHEPHNVKKIYHIYIYVSHETFLKLEFSFCKFKVMIDVHVMAKVGTVNGKVSPPSTNHSCRTALPLVLCMLKLERIHIKWPCFLSSTHFLHQDGFSKITKARVLLTYFTHLLISNLNVCMICHYTTMSDIKGR